MNGYVYFVPAKIHTTTQYNSIKIQQPFRDDVCVCVYCSGTIHTINEIPRVKYKIEDNDNGKEQVKQKKEKKTHKNGEKDLFIIL